MPPAADSAPATETGPAPGGRGRSLRASRVELALGLIGVWLLVGLLSAGQYSIAAWSAGEDPVWWLHVVREVPAWQAWTLLTPPIVLLARRFPLSRDRLLRHLPLHVTAAVLCALGYLGFGLLWTRVAMPSYFVDRSAGELYLAFFRARFNVAFLLYWGVVGVWYAAWNYRRLQQREVEAARAQAESARAREEAAEARAELVRSRLDALRSQLHPHFLFNTLHSIASLMDEDVGTARRLIARLSELLRSVLDSEEVQEVPLHRELELLERYLYIERVRYGGRLQVRFDIEEGTADALVPPLLLQPLVENAVRHGIAPLEQGGTVLVRSRHRAGRLRLVVRDTGRGYGNVDPGENGVGLRNTQARLQHLYGTDHTFEVRAEAGRGVCVTIEIPHRTHPASVSPTGVGDG